MRIEVRKEGGIAAIPGLSKPVVVDTETLAPPEAEKLTRLVGAARLFEQPKQIGSPSTQGADRQTYSIAIEDAGRTHEIRFADPVPSPELQALIDFVHRGANPKP